ncbi:MAG: glycosyltransferase family 4 protein [Candidatus Hermodarchaeota archaeon]
MRILYFVNYFPPNTGAAALNSQKITNYLINLGHELMVLAPGDMGKSFNLKIKKETKYTPNFKIRYSSSLFKTPTNFIFSHFDNLFYYLIKIKKRFSPDLILSQYHPFHYSSVCAGYLSKILKIPHIIRSHDIFIDLESHSMPYNTYISLNYPRIYRSILNCDTFYVTTSEMMRYFLKFKELNKVSFKVHHNGIDINQFYPYKNREELKGKLGCETIISFIGLMTPDIGIHNFIRVFPEIIKENKETHLILIGEGRYRKAISDLVNKLEMNKYIHFLGIQPHDKIPFYMNNSDIGIGRITHKKMWRYMIPVKCLEYMACKVPFITTPVSQDVVKNNDVGLLLKRNFTKKEIIDEFTMLIEDRRLRNDLGETGLKKIHDEFQWKSIMEAFNNDIENLYNKKK